MGLTFCATAFLVSCATSQNTTFTSATDRVFSARSATQIFSKGANVDESKLLRLGEMKTEIYLVDCFGDRCTTHNATGDATAELARKAAARGADSVLLQSDNAREEQQITKKGKCTRTETRVRVVTVGGDPVSVQKCKYLADIRTTSCWSETEYTERETKIPRKGAT
jgi:hypothetical protein